MRRDLFEGKSKAGPSHTMCSRRGDKFVDWLGEELLLKYPPDTTLVHAFTVRMIVIPRASFDLTCHRR
jgi:hypothetical protein